MGFLGFLKGHSEADDVDRNLRGSSLEKKGRTNKAIKLYEANVKSKFDGSHPYERLRIIYTKQKRYADAISVCRAYIQIAERQRAKGLHGMDSSSGRKKIDGFKHYLEKLEKKMVEKDNGN